MLYLSSQRICLNLFEFSIHALREEMSMDSGSVSCKQLGYRSFKNHLVVLSILPQ